MRRILVGVAVLGMVLGLSPATAFASTGADDSFPACADYSTTTSNGGYYYLDANGVPTLAFRYTMAAPSCTWVTYTFTVYSGTPDTGAVLWTDVRQGNGVTQTFYENHSFPNGPSSICAVGTTSAGPHVFDRAPETGCYPMTLSQGPPGISFG
jgi:hypothetical protein